MGRIDRDHPLSRAALEALEQPDEVTMKKDHGDCQSCLVGRLVSPGVVRGKRSVRCTNKHCRACWTEDASEEEIVAQAEEAKKRVQESLKARERQKAARQPRQLDLFGGR